MARVAIIGSCITRDLWPILGEAPADLLYISRTSLPSLESALRLPAWMWFGGALGAGFVIIATLAIPRIGASPLVALVVFGQMAAALAYDRFGVLQPVQAISASRLFGALLILVGVLMVLQPWKAR